jgi:2-polyprenyl-3-methyl-5-hydroxy-6-metoxy-1,4-benzoquinol methylase/tetratricopeptide (TPR) repeat protein
MNRKARRGEAKRLGNLATEDAGDHLDSSDLFYTEVMWHYRQGALHQAEVLCRSALDRNPGHLRALVVLGDIVQQSGRNKLAVKLLRGALEIDCTDVAAHDTLALAYQALGRAGDAVRHFTEAIALGLNEPEALAKRSQSIASLLRHLDEVWPRQLGPIELLGVQGANSLGREPMLLALLQARPIHDLELERLLTAVRRGLLYRVAESPDFDCDSDALEFFCALARQCFINEYVFALLDREREDLKKIYDRLVDAIQSRAPVSPLTLVVVASYLPLHTILGVELLLTNPQPDPVARLLKIQVQEPREEESDCANIPALTPINDAVSLQVRNQYEENPYPRWSVVPQIKPTTVANFFWDHFGFSPQEWPRTRYGVEMLIAGCGTGSHSIDSAIRFPKANILAVDISRASLAFARRQSRALALTNVEYAQADILELATISDRRFDVIETVGVLHHLFDPSAGWQGLLSLLRPNGLMFIGLYSDTGRRSLSSARSLIAERGYRPVPEDIRACRQDLIGRGWAPQFRDFSSTSGCRDLLFNVMEHRFDIPQIRHFVETHGLQFLGFEQLPPGALDQFRQRYSEAASTDLGAWHSFEQEHPQTFANMYMFWVQKVRQH